MVIDDSPLRILVLGTRAPGRSVIAHGLVSAGHEAMQSWDLQHLQTVLAPGRFDALIAMIGPGQVTLRMLARIVPELGAPRRTALIAIAASTVHGQESEVRRIGFDRLLVEPLAPPRMVEAVVETAMPLRAPPALHRALRATLAEAVLAGREAAVQAMAVRLVEGIEGDAATVASAAIALAEACAEAGFPAAELAARHLAAEPARPYCRRALASAMGAARSAARAERLRREANNPI